ncbi:histone acetyltransferase type B [Lojkania enalia]|uniref:Histone acetyltransferase type B catalytic subunit n=1 Tax=Lojkania enalia TaxID=147567 RepID=A0A9P4TRC6_9PLEO|nr:histone acetyltransferase type B [Didymosphaeria enalia]
MDLMEDWITDSNECFFINLTRPGSSPNKPERVFDESFNPNFTYELFGDEQKLIGYKEPRITLEFRANDLAPALDVKFKQKLDLAGLLPDNKQLDIKEPFKDILPASAFDTAEVSSHLGPDPTSNSWKPPGKLLRSFALLGKQYEVWTTSLADPVALQMFRNIQILVLLFIEGGSQLELDEDWTLERWTLYLLYEVTPLKNQSVSPYTIAGFSTSYRYWVFPTFEIMSATNMLPSPPDSTNGDAMTFTPPGLTQDPETHLFNEHINPLEAQSRERISQFIILPPFQGQSLGGKLYDTIFGVLIKVPNIYEIAVEDPSEAFDVMRDYSDITYLRALPEFKALSLASSLSPEQLKKDAPVPRDFILGNGADLDALRHKTKIVPRQFNRVLEIHLLSTIPPLHRSIARITRKDKSSNENDRKYYFWRLALKDRIYRQNADVLEQLEDPTERVERLENAVDDVQNEYTDRLNGIDRRAEWETDDEEVQNGETSRAKRKRVVIDEDDDEADGESVASSKKVKI